MTPHAAPARDCHTRRRFPPPLPPPQSPAPHLQPLVLKALLDHGVGGQLRRQVCGHRGAEAALGCRGAHHLVRRQLASWHGLSGSTSASLPEPGGQAVQRSCTLMT